LLKVLNKPARHDNSECYIQDTIIPIQLFTTNIDTWIHTGANHHRQGNCNAEGLS